MSDRLKARWAKDYRRREEPKYIRLPDITLGDTQRAISKERG